MSHNDEREGGYLVKVCAICGRKVEDKICCSHNGVEVYRGVIVWPKEPIHLVTPGQVTGGQIGIPEDRPEAPRTFADFARSEGVGKDVVESLDQVRTRRRPPKDTGDPPSHVRGADAKWRGPGSVDYVFDWPGLIFCFIVIFAFGLVVGLAL